MRQLLTWMMEDWKIIDKDEQKILQKYAFIGKILAMGYASLYTNCNWMKKRIKNNNNFSKEKKIKFIQVLHTQQLLFFFLSQKFQINLEKCFSLITRHLFKEFIRYQCILVD